MKKMYLINEEYYVVAFDYYDAIQIFQDYKKEYKEDIIEKIEIVSTNVIEKKKKLEEDEDE